MNDIQRRVRADVASYGWHVIKVAEGDVDEPAFAYTVGLTETFDHPEVAVVGLSLETMHHLLNAVGERVRQGHAVKRGRKVDGLLEGHDCKFVAVDPRHLDEWFGQALAYYGAAPVSVLQCLWPDREGCFPDSERYAESLRARQPLLSA